MKYFLIKTEPSGYSIDRFASDKTTSWNGVRNPQAVNFLKQMNPGDMCLVYHTEGQCSIVGLARVLGNSRPDPNDSKSWLVDMEYIRSFPPPQVTLQQIKKSGKFPDFRLVKQSRLSVMDVPSSVLTYLKSEGLAI